MTDYKFPFIENISDVLPYIDGWDEFRVIDHAWYNTVNYMVSMEKTFSDVEGQSDYGTKIRRECRGLIFDSETGELLSRSYHKFFNVNEREETQIDKINLYEPHVVLEKLDGSMIRPIPTEDGFRLASKAGITDVSVNAERFIFNKENYRKFIDKCIQKGTTPIFEWCSRKNRIVIDYPEDSLILTGIRYNYTGQYVQYKTMSQYASAWDIPVVKAVDGLSVQNIHLFVKQVREWDDGEGVVIRFDDGRMFKVKADQYCLFHKTKDQISQEKNVISIILEDKIDDILPILTSSDHERLEEYKSNFWKSLESMAVYLNNLYSMGESLHLNDKDYAVKFVNSDLVHQNYRSIMFKMRKSNQNVKDILIEIVKNNLSSQSKVDKIRWIFQSCKWN